MDFRNPVIALMLFAGCQFSASCGNTTIDKDKAQDFVTSALEKDTGQKPVTTCPGSIKAEKDKTFICTAKFGAAMATVEILMNDTKGNVTIKKITGILISAKLEAQIAETVGSKLNVHVKVSCGDRVRAAKAGDTFLCDAADAKGTSGKVKVEVKDADGSVSYELVQDPAPAPEAPSPP